MKIEPLHNNVLIKQQDENELMYGNIIVPDAGKEKPLLGEIVAVGPGSWSVTGDNFIETKVEVGQTVCFPSFGGQRITVESEEYIICKETDLLAVLKK
jgi:chaperonin GroES